MLSNTHFFSKNHESCLHVRLVYSFNLIVLFSLFFVTSFMWLIGLFVSFLVLRLSFVTSFMWLGLVVSFRFSCVCYFIHVVRFRLLLLSRWFSSVDGSVA